MTINNKSIIMKKILILLTIILLSSCNNKEKIVENLKQDTNNTLEDYIKELGEPIAVSKSTNEYETPVIERTWYTFLIEESSKKSCELELHEGKSVLDRVVDISFENPMKVEYGCMRSVKEMSKVKNDILDCVKGNTFSAASLSGGSAGSLTLNSDMSYNYVTSLLGGFASMGTWEIKNQDLGSALIILSPPQQQVNSGNVPSQIYVDAYKDCTLRIGETNYFKK